MKKIVEDTTTELPNEYKDISELPEDFFVSGDAPSEGWIRLKKGIVQKFRQQAFISENSATDQFSLVFCH